jgi:ribose 5-phosphate isomerase B
MCIVANKTKGARAIMGYSIEAAEKGRLEEDAQIICLAGRVLSDEHAAAIVKKFLETEFDGQAKRVRRLKKIAELEA